MILHFIRNEGNNDFIHTLLEYHYGICIDLYDDAMCIIIGGPSYESENSEIKTYGNSLL